jgi:hypothetical protein
MTRTSIFAAALLSASAVALLPLTANASEDDGARVSRNWTGNNSATTGAKSSRRGTAANQRTNPTVAAPKASPVDNSREYESRSNRDIASNDDDGDGDNRRYSRRHHDEGGLDPAEAARIRRAHEDSDGHVYLRRDRDEYGTRSYRSGYSTTYRGDWEAPRPPRHHRRWWHAWWH